MRRLAVLAFLVAGTLLAPPARAGDAPPATGDEVVVTLPTGATLRGTLIEQSQGGITLRQPGGATRRLNYDTFRDLRRDEEAMASRPPAVGDQVVVTLASGGTVRGKLVAQDPWHLAVLIPDGPVREMDLPGVKSLRRADGSPAQPAEDAPRPPSHLRIGLGVALPATGSFPSFYLPVQSTPSFRLEPEVGLLRVQVNGESATGFQLGLGLLATRTVAPQAGAYGGLRFQLQRFDASGADGFTSLRVAGVLGAEWQPATHVAFGVEAQAGYVNVDRPAGSSGAASGLSTAGLVFLRAYLN